MTYSTHNLENTPPSAYELTPPGFVAVLRAMNYYPVQDSEQQALHGAVVAGLYRNPHPVLDLSGEPGKFALSAIRHAHSNPAVTQQHWTETSRQALAELNAATSAI